MQSERELEQLIDAALPSYSAAEPLAGFEDRILSRTFAEPSPKQLFPWRWAFVAPALACLLIVIVLFNRHSAHRGAPAASPSIDMQATKPAPIAPSLVANIATTPTPRAQPKSFAPHPITAKSQVADDALPKEDTFPSSSPLTAEDRALIAYNRDQSLAASTRPVVKLGINPLTISELHIEPLDIPALDPAATQGTGSGQNQQQP